VLYGHFVFLDHRLFNPLPSTGSSPPLSIHRLFNPLPFSIHRLFNTPLLHPQAVQHYSSPSTGCSTLLFSIHRLFTPPLLHP